MKCTLIRCPQTFAKYVSAAYALPPIGIAYVAATLREAGHEVSIIDSQGEALDQFTPLDAKGLMLRRGLTDEQILERLDDADLIGFGLTFSQDWLPTRELIKKVHARRPRAVLIAGGEHFTAEPVGTLEDSPLSFVLEGEGDRVICDLVEHLEGKRSLEEVPGCWYRTADGEIRRTCGKVRVRDIDSLPWPAWDLVPVESYLSGGYMVGVDRGRSMPMIATRGCPYQCTFCSSPTMWTTRYTAREPADVIREIKHYIATFQATNFDFQDLTAIVKKEWALRFCQQLLAENLDITWQIPSGTRSEALDGEVLELMVKSGCTNFAYAPESGDEATLKRIKKRIHKDKMVASMRSAVKAGCNVKANFIFGFPEDTYRSIFNTFAFLARIAVIGVHDISIAPLRPYPGSEIFRDLQAKGVLPKKLDDAYYHDLATGTENLPGTMDAVPSYTDHISARGLDRLRIVGMAIFFMVSWAVRPLRLFKVVRAVITEKQESRLDKSLVEMKRRILRARRLKQEPGLALGEINPY
jgi:anaerobic magnesium-protoporphyrin IX monomethyl ester cyclase